MAAILSLPLLGLWTIFLDHEVERLRDFRILVTLVATMVLGLFVFLKQFPLTPNGKVDVRNLPSPALAGEATINLVAPRNNSEQQLAGIWREVLMVSAIGIDDDFFDLGGDSLTATRAFARTNQAFGTALTLREMLDHPTIRGLSEMIATSNRVAPACPPLIPRRARSLARN